MLLNIVNIGGTEILSIDNYSNATDYKRIITNSKDKFVEAKNKNILVRCDFDDDLWILFDTKIETKLKFDFSELDFARYAKNRFNCTFKEFKDLAKAYIVTLLPHLSARTINRVVAHINTVAKRTDFFSTEKAEEFINIDNTAEFINIENSYFNAIEFFKIIPMNNSSEFTEIVEDIFWELNSLNKNNKLQRRELSDFYSVLLFDKVINYWWDNSDNLDEKVLYYPIYIWWKLTSILPLRVVELSVIPYNCTYCKDNKYFVRVRRSVIKGKNFNSKKQKIHHNLNSDYKMFEYEVTKEIFDILEEYKKIICQYNPNNSRRMDDDVLFDKKVLTDHKKLLKMATNHSKSVNVDIFTYVDLRNLLTSFYKKIISDKFGFDIVKKGVIESEMLNLDKAMRLDKITKISLGDTRHIAMINMSLSDFNPILIKDFVNHSDINTTYHYSQNVEKVVKCMTYIKYQQLRNRENSNNTELKINNGFSSASVLAMMDNDSNFKEVDNGRCYSTKFLKGDITDCLTSGFEIGDCSNCDYFVQSSNYTDEQISKKTETLENALKREGFFFANALKKYSKDSNDAEFKKAMLRLQTSASQYQSQLEKNIREI